MNPKLVEEVARAMFGDFGYGVAFDTNAQRDAHNEKCDADHIAGYSKKDMRELAQAAIRVCMARAAEIAIDHGATTEDYDGTYRDGCEAAADAIKREGGLT